jgi:hypothetical protein
LAVRRAGLIAQVSELSLELAVSPVRTSQVPGELLQRRAEPPALGREQRLHGDDFAIGA